MKRKPLLHIFLLTSFLITLFNLHNPIESLASTSKKITLIVDSRQIYSGNSMSLAQAPTQIKDGVTYVPLRALGDIIGATTSYDAKTKNVTLLKDGKRLQLRIDSQLYTFNYGQKKFPIGKPFLDGNTTMLPLRTIAEHFDAIVTPRLSEKKIDVVFQTKTDSKPIVVIPAQPSFTTDKSEYKIGEKIHYYDTSTAGTYKLVKRTWHNNEPAFFTSGPKQIRLEVEDASGQKRSFVDTIYVTNEVLYTREEFNLMHADVGTKITINGLNVLEFDAIDFQFEDKPYQLIRSNSPEQITREGIYYMDEVKGDARLFIHHQSARSTGSKLYVVAENKSNTDSYVHKTNVSIAGPSKYPSFTGKESVSRYLSNLGLYKNAPVIQVPAGSKALLFPELSNKTMKFQDTVTMYADIFATTELSIKIIALDAPNHLNDVYPFLKNVEAERDGIHVRGTFPNSNRDITIDDRLGTTRQRLLLGDGQVDSYSEGTDNLTGLAETNYGNYGQLYTIRLKDVAPQTTIVFNGRGGAYSGAAIVNGRVIRLPNDGVLEERHDGVVLHRTKNRAEEVVIQFTPASASNLPVNLLFYPGDR